METILQFFANVWKSVAATFIVQIQILLLVGLKNDALGLFFIILLIWFRCRQKCIWKTVKYFNDFGIETPQFFGKWPFIPLEINFFGFFIVIQVYCKYFILFFSSSK